MSEEHEKTEKPRATLIKQTKREVEKPEPAESEQKQKKKVVIKKKKKVNKRPERAPPPFLYLNLSNSSTFVL